ncbi:phage tail protein [Aminobacterium sp. UBA5514]|uniref:phage tail protein n=1 Tax=Aminobacterium sp. UBA5514 TaxID=1946036 RepID=UPI00257B9283|nr:phage tail protein [Aminobacterium sp. UBA5514]
MAENFYTILTNTGKAKLANAQALGTTVQFSSIAVGDGAGNYYEPAESQAALKNEVWRGPINQIKTDSENPNWIIVEVVVPTTTGGFTVREAGIIDSEGDLIALGKYPATYKPALAEGSGKDLYIRMILEVSNASTIMLKIDPAIVLSTRGYVDDSIAEHNTAPLAHGNLPYLKTSEVVVSPEPNKVLKLDAAGKLPGDITGNAATSSLAVNATYWNGRRLLDKASTTQPIGLVLVEPGGGAGFWDWVDLDGNPVMPPPGYFSSRPEYQISVSMVDNQAMVEISQFYFLVKTLPSGPYAGKQARFINKTAFSGAKLHPAFLNGGVEISSFYIGAYEAFGDGETKTGSSVKKPPLVSIDFPTMVSRCNARNVSGVTGFSLINIYQIAAIQMLAHVEMGTTDSQSVFGRGNCDSPVPYASGGWALSTGYTNAIWRGIHELWGNTWCMVQGLENRNGAIWVWDSGGGKSFVNTGEVFPDSGHPTEMHVASGANFDLSALYLPKTTISSQDNGTYSDYFWIIKDGTTKVCYHGGYWNYGSRNGLFYLNLNNAASSSTYSIGGRIAKV